MPKLTLDKVDDRLLLLEHMDEDRFGKVKNFYHLYHRLPSYSEMLELFGLRSKNAIYKIVKKWIKEGFLTKTNKKISPTPRFFARPMLGYIKAGFPNTADEDFQFLSLDDYLIDKPDSSFLLKVKGDSLNGIGIMPGDLVIIERQNQASQNQIVLSQIDGEWVLKIFKKDKRKVALISANPAYPPLYPEEELKIFGVVVGVVRKLF